uniref:HHH_2 domain-containing protein n=1 Tax=Steinernema glaseri TaxID=37863 RepID=A0A1I7YT10_9BILA
MASTSAPSTSNPSAQGSSKLLVNRRRQNGNPVLKYIRKVPYEYVPDIKADFEAGAGCGIFYLAMKFHKLHPSYLETRFTEAGNYPINILLVYVNVEEPRFLLKDLNLFCYRTGWTLVLAYSVEEAAEYIENIKFAENKTTVSALQESHKRQMQKEAGPSKMDSRKELMQSALAFLSSIRSVNSTDAQRLIATFGSIQNIAKASADDLAMCPGLGPVKAQNIHNFFRTPFLK